MQRGMFEHIFWTFKQMRCSSNRPPGKPVSWEQETQATICSCSCPWHLDGRVRIWHKQHEIMDPSCSVLAIQAAGDGEMMLGDFTVIKWAPRPTDLSIMNVHPAGVPNKVPSESEFSHLLTSMSCWTCTMCVSVWLVLILTFLLMSVNWENSNDR